MSVKSFLGHALGFVAGILIPGASVTATDGTHTVQQLFADLYGTAAAALAQQLKLDTTGMTGPQKVFYIADAMVQTALAQGFKGDVAVLKAALLDVAQAAYRKSIATAESDILALLASIHAGPTLTSVATLVLPVVEQKVEGAAAGTLGLPHAA